MQKLKRDLKSLPTWPIRKWKSYWNSEELVTPNHPMVLVFYLLSIATGLIYILGIQEASAMTEVRGEAFVGLWQVLSLIAGLLGVWGVVLASARKRDPRDGFKIELVGAIWVAIAQSLYLDSLVTVSGVGAVAQTQLYSFMFAAAAAIRALQLPFEIARATRLLERGPKGS